MKTKNENAEKTDSLKNEIYIFFITKNMEIFMHQHFAAKILRFPGTFHLEERWDKGTPKSIVVQDLRKVQPVQNIQTSQFYLGKCA